MALSDLLRYIGILQCRTLQCRTLRARNAMGPSFFFSLKNLPNLSILFFSSNRILYSIFKVQSTN